MSQAMYSAPSSALTTPIEMPKLYNENDQWVVPGKQGSHSIRQDVPSVPSDLCAWLNERRVPSEPVGTSTAEPAPNTVPDTVSHCTTLDAGKIIEWIMDTATAAQIENIFTALGVRFHELKKDVANRQP